MKKHSLFAVLCGIALVCGCQSPKNSSPNIIGNWRTIDAPDYCLISVDKDSASWVDIDPENYYRYKMINDTLVMYNPSISAIDKWIVKKGEGDTLFLKNIRNSYEDYVLLPFK